MKTKFLFFIIYAILLGNGYAQTKKLWDRAYGGLSTDGGSFIHHNTINGKIYVFGSFGYSSPDPKDLVGCTQYGKMDFITICYDSTGKKLWDLSIGGSDDDGISSKVIPQDDGYEIFILSKSNNSGLIGKIPCTWGNQIAYFKIDFNGKILFSNSFCADGYTIDRIYDIKKFSTGYYGFLLQVDDGTIDPPNLAYFSVNSSMGLVSQNIFQTSYNLSFPASNIVEESNGGYSIVVTYDYDNTNCPASNSEPASCARIITFDVNHKIIKQKIFYSIKSQTLAAGLLKKNNEYYLLLSSEPNITLTKDVIGLCTNESKYLRNMAKAPVKNSNPNKDLWLIKTTASFQVINETSYGTNGLILPNVFDFKQDSTILIACTTNGSASYDKIKATNGGLDYWGINLKNDLTLISENSFGSGSSEDIYSFTADWQGNYYSGFSKSDKGGERTDITRGEWDIWSVVECVKPVSTYSVDPKDTSIIAGTLVKFYNSSTSCNRFYWDFGDGSYSTNKEPVHYFNAVGKYNVKLVVSNAFCKDSLTKNNLVNVTKYVGLEQHEADSKISLFPNPFINTVNISIGNSFERVSINVFNSIGELVFQQQEFSSGSIDIPGLTNGMYFINIVGKKFNVTKKILKNE